MGSIEHTAAGTWRARWRDAYGRSRRRTFKHKGDAKVFLASFEVDTRRGAWVDPAAGRISVAAWVQECGRRPNPLATDQTRPQSAVGRKQTGPLLVPMRRDLQFAVERWADEEAAAVTHRTVIASALAKAAMAILRLAEGRVAPPAMHLHTYAVTERVSALLDEPAQRSRLAWAFFAVAMIAAASLAWAMHDTERFFEAVRLWRHP
jgi:hypothetical protein